MNARHYSAIMDGENGSLMQQEAESSIVRGLSRVIDAAESTSVTESGAACRDRAECMRRLLSMDELQLGALHAAMRQASEG